MIFVILFKSIISKFNSVQSNTLYADIKCNTKMLVFTDWAYKFVKENSKIE